MASTSLFGKLRMITNRHPMVRGMLSYAILWPTGSALQQVLEGTTLGTFDWKRCLRYSIYGTLVVAPTLYGWVRLSSAMWPATNLKTGLIKATVEQISYGPFSMTCFFVGMNLLEFKTLRDGFKELTEKFVPTWKVGICFWPVLQTINFALVPEKNRVVLVSIMSVLWTTFLAYMKQMEGDEHMSKESKIHQITILGD